MNVKEENVCRLCLKVAEKDFEIIDEITREIFEVLLLRVNLAVSKDPIVCKDCAEVVEKCFNFKSACINTEELVFSYAIDKKRATFEMKDIYKDEKGIEIDDDNFICRFCSNLISESNFVLFDTLMNNVTFAKTLLTLMPEMDFDIIRNPIICQQDLECYIKFIENCRDVEEKITKYLQNKGTPSSVQVKLSEIMRFSLKKRVIQQDFILEDIHETHSERDDSELIKTEEIDIKDEGSNLNKTASKIPSKSLYKCDVQSNIVSLETGMGKAYQKKYKSEAGENKISKLQSTKKISDEARVFKCAKCTFKTKHKYCLKTHMLIHKDITEVEMYTCSICSYKTKVKGNLKIHMLVHKDITEVEVYKCSTCTYQTKRKGHFTRHMLIHKKIRDKKIYKCSTCTYQAKQEGNLKTSILIHKDNMQVEMYKCSMCTYQAKYKGTFKRHMLIHKDVTEVEMFKCSMCTYQAKRKCILKTHMLIHKDVTEVEMHKCSMCTYQAKQKGNLKRHMLNHKDITEVEVYKCSMCTYQSKHKSGLKTHMLIHNKDITKCSMCTYQTREPPRDLPGKRKE